MLSGRIEDLMSENVVKIKESARIKDAAHILLRFQINGLLVVNESQKEVVGIITTTDLLRLIDQALSEAKKRKAALEKIATMRISSVASRTVIKIQKTTRIQRVVSIMHNKNVHTIPVYDGRKLVGVIGKHDIINAAFYSQKT